MLFYASVGWSLKHLRYALGLAEGTITHHLRLALRKVGMSSRAELVQVTTEIAMRAMMGGDARCDATAARRDALTAAEQAVVDGVIAGHSNERIATSRGVSPRTVANQLTNVYRKLGLHGRHELVRDEAGHISAYTMMSQRTADETPPVAGDAGLIALTPVNKTTLLLNWTVGTDSFSPQGSLEYLAVRSDSSNIFAASNAIANGTVVMDWTAATNAAGRSR